MPDPLTVCRYHSLIVAKDSLPAQLEMTAWTENEMQEVDEIMGLCHTEMALEGMQFHPEAILTEQGLALLNNFIRRFSS